jgi:hypothetical protein
LGADDLRWWGRNVDATWGIAMLVVGLIISIVAVIIGEGIIRTVLFAVGLLLLLGGVVVLDYARRG